MKKFKPTLKTFERKERLASFKVMFNLEIQKVKETGDAVLKKHLIDQAREIFQYSKNTVATDIWRRISND